MKDEKDLEIAEYKKNIALNELVDKNMELDDIKLMIDNFDNFPKNDISKQCKNPKLFIETIEIVNKDINDILLYYI